MDGLGRAGGVALSRTQWLATVVLPGRLSLAPRQTDRGTIEGTVTDPTGAAVHDARVQIVRLQTEDVIRLATDDRSRYAVPNLSLGTYRLVVDKPGFRTVRREPVYLQSQCRVRVDLTPEQGSGSGSTTIGSPKIDSPATTSAWAHTARKTPRELEKH